MNFARISRSRAWFAVCGLLSLSSLPLHAALLVYEGFNGYTGTNLAGQTPNGNTVGLDTSVGYYDGAASPRTAGFSLQTTGLTLGSLATSGGALAFATGTNVMGADIDIGATAYTGTLWNSYLVNISFKGTSVSGEGAVLRVGAMPSDSNNSHFNSWADSRNGSPNIAVGYGSTGTDGSDKLTNGTTYIIISKFTRVGQSVSPTTPGVATQWALDAAQFAAFLSAGGDEAALNSVTVTGMSTNTTTSSSTNIFSSAMAFGLVTVNDVGVFDEIRYGSDLASVTPSTIPEPAAAALLSALAALGLCSARRRPRTA